MGVPAFSGAHSALLQDELDNSAQSPTWFVLVLRIEGALICIDDLKSLALLLTGFGLLLGYPPASGAQENPVTAIDIALEPDATMIQHAEAANARLRKVFPEATL